MGLGGRLVDARRGAFPPAMRMPRLRPTPFCGWWKGLVLFLSAGGLIAQPAGFPGGGTSFRNTSLGENALASIDLSGDFLSRAPESAMNVAVGYAALLSNTTGYRNVAVGAFALGANVSGHGNVAIGRSTLGASISGAENTAVGNESLSWLQSGSGNVAVGSGAGAWLTNGSDNLYLGTTTAFPGGRPASESGIIRIGDIDGRHRALFLGGIQEADASTAWPLAIQRDGKVVRLTSLPDMPGGTPVVVDAAGHLGRMATGGDANAVVGAGAVPGSILLLRSGSPAPTGFTRLGVLRSEYRADGSGVKDITFDLYVKP